jgi:twitching motility protein PilI
MARVSLREYQSQLTERLRSAESGGFASKLGLQVGEQSWLVDLTDAGEVIPVPPIAAVPLTRPWFRGVANIRGNLYSVIDFSAFLGGKPATSGEQSRLVLVGDRLRIPAALLVDRSLGLHSPAQLQALPAENANAPWIKTRYTDADGKRWIELDVPQLVQHPHFLGVAA